MGRTQDRNSQRFMGEAGTLGILAIEYPRKQILSIGEILQDKRFLTPTAVGGHKIQPRIAGISAVGV
ncbi:MAG: hypothetical protein J4G14_14175 [Dehalococcoidia bacterium]|nr:hypothetical protein [Dehalococcoidia bacterium]